MGGLFDVLMPGLHHGRPVLAFQTTRFDPELTFDLIPRLGVRNVFMPATALRMMAAHDGPAAGAAHARERRRDGRRGDRRVVLGAARRDG